MHLRLSLRTRFLLACLGLGGALIGGFTFALHQFIEVLENSLSKQEFRDEYVRYARLWEAGDGQLPPLHVGWRAYVAHPGDSEAVPDALMALSPGVHEEEEIDGRVYAVARHDTADASLFLLRDSRYDAVERLESQLGEIALFAFIAATLMGSGMALWLVKIVMRPVDTLATHVKSIVPGAPRVRLEEADADPELDLIARAFDDTLDRYDELVERERAFARDASHELRTPLAVILTGIELLETTPADDLAVAGRLGRVRAAAEQMQALTEGLLFLARSDPPPSVAPYAVSAVLDDAVRIQRLATPQALDLRIVAGGEPWLTVPRGLLLCVLGNVLRNAVEHGGDGPIAIRLDVDGVTIEDTGPGIETSLLPGVFDRNRRGATSSGEGLGLYIVRRICARAGWSLSMHTAAGAGTRCDLRFAATGCAAETLTDS